MPGSISIRIAERTRDNAALCALAAVCPQGGQWRFAHDRTDFWERCSHFSNCEILVAEQEGTLLGCTATGWKTCSVRGRSERIAYSFDRMVHPDARRRGIARALLEEQLVHNREAALQYGVVLADNVGMQRILLSAGFQPLPRALLIYALLPGWTVRGRGGSAAPALGGMANAGDKAWESLRNRYDWVDLPEPDHCLVQSTTAAQGILFHLGYKKLVQAPWLARAAARLLPLPRIGVPFQSWALSHLQAEDPAALDQLLQNVAAAARQAEVPTILVPLFEDDPWLRAVRRRSASVVGVQATRAFVYVRGPLAAELLAASRPLLASGRDV